MAWHIGRYFCDYIQFQTRQTTELKLFWQLNRLQNGMIALRMLCRCEERSNIHNYSTAASGLHCTRTLISQHHKNKKSNDSFISDRL